MKALQGVIPVWWKPSSEPEGGTRFKLRPLTGMQSFTILSRCVRNEIGELMVSPEAAEEAIRLSVMKVENMEGYNPEIPIIDQLPDYEAVRELATHIVGQAALTESEKKASGSPQPLENTPECSTAKGANGESTAPPGSAIPNGQSPTVEPQSPNG